MAECASDAELSTRNLHSQRAMSRVNGWEVTEAENLHKSRPGSANEVRLLGLTETLLDHAYLTDDLHQARANAAWKHDRRRLRGG